MRRILTIFALLVTIGTANAESGSVEELRQFREMLAQRRDLDEKRENFERISKEVTRSDMGLPTMVQPRELYPAQQAVNAAQDRLKQLRARLGATRPNLLQWQMQQVAKLVSLRGTRLDGQLEADITLAKRILEEEAPPVEWRRHSPSDPLAPVTAGSGEFRYR